ncbi:multiheme c-type cytochrome [Endozoicomonas ascidiicola]|uniref:multiheme c-type cytochrome n=1 Tax=Endozoicomonas ascidiicola TaxID=1698521 RepID=UPI00082958E7|nr:multiheme c-type cytochrome [Endozoicomonas ascidiicola]
MQNKNNKKTNCLIFKHWLAIFITLIAIPSAFAFPEKELTGTTGFVGSDACMNCHQSEYQAWLGSDHQKAMQHANKLTVQGNFANKRFQYNEFQYQFQTEGDLFVIVADDQNGKAARYEVLYTFGVDPLQQYLVETGNGRLQALPVAWDTRPSEQGGQRWFHIYPDENLDYTDSLHWTGLNQNWNYMCADCHSTNLQKNYDTESEQFKTTWSEISVGCEACHGPGAEHIQWSNNPQTLQTDDSKGLSIQFLPSSLWAKTLTNLTTEQLDSRQLSQKSQELEVCARCHSRRTPVSETDYSNFDFGNHFNLSLLTPELYHVDGQIKDEVFEHGSFLQSKMYDRGVTCSNCHDPHSQKLKLPKAQVCSQCHDSRVYDTQKHTLHPSPTTGSHVITTIISKQPDCLDCHMPARNFMVIDGRRDHSFRIPRPDLTVAIDTPNACQNCHSEQSPQWAADVIKQSTGKSPHSFQTFPEVFSRADKGAPDAAKALIKLIRDVQQPDIVRATALQRLRPYLHQQSSDIVIESLNSPSDLVRHSAVQLASMLPPNDRQTYLLPLLKDPLLPIRIEAARTLGTIPIHQLDSHAATLLGNALREFENSQAFNGDRPESHLNLGNLAREQQLLDKAVKHYQQALNLDQRFSPARVNLIETIRRLDGEQQSLRTLNKALLLTPEDPALHMARGFAMVRQKQPASALKNFAKAVSMAPENTRYLYIYGVALQTAGEKTLAIKQFIKAYHLFNANPDILRVLTNNALQNQNWSEALKYAIELDTVQPGNPQIQQLIRQLESQ